MVTELTSEQRGAVSMLLQAGKTVKDIAKFAELEASAVTAVARTLDLEPGDPAHRRAKQLFASPQGLSYQEIAKQLTGEGMTADDGSPMHHLTVASWVKNYGWPWGGAADGDYAPERQPPQPPQNRYVLRLSKSLDAEMNSDAAIHQAAEVAWGELSSGATRVVQLAVIRGCGSVGVTDLALVKKALMDQHGDEIRSAKIND